MILTWYGHACFQLCSEDGTVVFDPYAPGKVPGLMLPVLTADVVISSHQHGDHYYPEGVKLSGKEPHWYVRQVPAFHDDRNGQLRGENLITILETEHIRVAHFGDLGHDLTEDDLTKIGHVDVIMIPVGGFYTIDAVQAKRIVQQLQPQIVIPMHYRNRESGLQNIAELKAFTDLFQQDEILYLDGQKFELCRPISPAVVVFQWPEAQSQDD